MSKKLHHTQVLISQVIAKNLPAEGKLFEILHYVALPVGKCLRGYLMIESAKALGSTSEQILDVAAAIELIHTYSLVHDDLPALDDDDMRRGKLACHKMFGEANAILAGSFLLMLSFEIVARCLPVAVSKMAKFVNEMIEGQAHDLVRQDNDCIDDVMKMYTMKTGSLFAMALTCGALLSNCDFQTVSCLEKYGYEVGLAFQMVDDLSDASGLVKIIEHRQIVFLIDQAINEAKHTLDSMNIKSKFFFAFAEHIRGMPKSCT